jgi:hypothetical protein
MVLVFSLINPRFFSVGNSGDHGVPGRLRHRGRGTDPVVLTGNFDISIGSISGSPWWSWQSSSTSQAAFPIPVIIAAGLAVGLIIGVINGLLITRIGSIPSSSPWGPGDIPRFDVLLVAFQHQYTQRSLPAARKVLCLQRDSLPFIYFLAALVVGSLLPKYTRGRNSTSSARTRTPPALPASAYGGPSSYPSSFQVDGRPGGHQRRAGGLCQLHLRHGLRVPRF